MFLVGIATHIIAFHCLIIVGLFLTINNMKVLGQAPILYYDNKTIVTITALGKIFLSLLIKTLYALFSNVHLLKKLQNNYYHKNSIYLLKHYSIVKPLRAPPVLLSLLSD